MTEKILLVDTDPGVDDCAALMMLMSQVPKVKIVGITCAAGNVGLRDVTINTVRIVKLFDMLNEIPIFGGCSEPMVLLPKTKDAAFYHGRDGLGDAHDVYPERSESLLDHVQAEHGVDAILRLSKVYTGRLQLICLGALTNIAMAAKIDTDLPKRIKSVHILGGTIEGYGNATPCAEYNFYTDPEAAYTVFRMFPQHCKTEVVPYETTVAHGIRPDLLNKLMSVDSKRAQFFKAIFAAAKVYEDRKIAKGVSPGYCLCDAYVTAIVLNEDAVTKSKSAKVAVEISGLLSRGSFIVDHKNKGSSFLSSVDVTIIEELDDAICEDLITKAFTEYRE